MMRRVASKVACQKIKPLVGIVIRRLEVIIGIQPRVMVVGMPTGYVQGYHHRKCIDEQGVDPDSVKSKRRRHSVT